ncbi:MAG: hypothetical protein QM831_32525 [Kofleriaceae bacterium]
MKWLVLLLVGCTDVHHISLEIGTSTELSSGFTCPDPTDPNRLLLLTAINDQQELVFNMVVDFINLGDTTPVCLADRVSAACQGDTCHVSVVDAPERFCREVRIEHDDLVQGQARIRELISQQLGQVTAEAPHRVVITRAVATTEDCADVRTSDGTDWSTLDKSKVLGCAYSCPYDLDDVDGDLELGLNAVLTNATPAQCVLAIDACATFPH